MTQLCRKLGPDLGTQKLTSATGQNPLAAFTMPSCRNRTCDSACATLIWFYSLWRMNLTKMTQLCRKLVPDLGTQKLTSATGQSPPVAFTMPSCKNRTCDSACATLIWFCCLRRMHLTKMTQLCRKLGPDLGNQSWPSQTDIIHWRHSPYRHAKTIHATRPVQLLFDSAVWEECIFFCERWILPKWRSSAENWDRTCWLKVDLRKRT